MAGTTGCGRCWPGPCRFLELPRWSETAERSEEHLAGSWLLPALHLFQQQNRQICSEGTSVVPKHYPKLNHAGKGTQDQGHRPLFPLQGPRRRAATSACPRNAASTEKQVGERLSIDQNKEKQGKRQRTKFSHQQLQQQWDCQ